MREMRLGGVIQDVSEAEVAGMIVRSKQYMSLTTLLPMIGIMFFERVMVLLPNVQMMPALSSKMPLMRFIRVAGMWRTSFRST